MSQGLRKDNKKWYFDVHCTRLDGTTARKRISGFKTKAEAKRAEVMFLSSIEFDSVSNKVTIRQLANDFMQTKKGTIAKSTLLKNQTIIDLHIVPFFENLKFTDLDYKKILVWRDELRKKNLSNQRINTIVAKLREITKFGNDIYSMNINAFSRVDNLKVPKKKSKPIYSLEQFNTFINFVDDYKYMMLFHLMFWSGLRPGEMMALKWTDVNFDSKTIDVNKSCDQTEAGIEFKLVPPKNEQSYRSIDIDSTTTSMLKEYQIYCSNEDGYNKNWFVFGDEKPIKKTTLTNRLNYYCDKANLHRITPHSFRHSHVTFMLNKTGDYKAVSIRIGHKDAYETMNTYAGYLEENANKMMNAIEDNI